MQLNTLEHPKKKYQFLKKLIKSDSLQNEIVKMGEKKGKDIINLETIKTKNTKPEIIKTYFILSPVLPVFHPNQLPSLPHS